MQAVHLVGPSSSIFSQLLISPDTRSNNSDPVGAGCIRSAAGSGSFGTPPGKLAQQPVNPATLSGNSFFSSFSRQDGAAVLGISTVPFLLPGARYGRLAFLDFGLLSVSSGLILTCAIPLPLQHHTRHQQRARRQRRGVALPAD
ncbi:hypothetical protein DXK93_18795 [Achromobacter sp. K91]|nr:hypothetical protein DXK93_18795 [Achromobacter sp. K91]